MYRFNDNTYNFPIFYSYFHFGIYKIHIIFSDINSIGNISNIYFIKCSFLYGSFIISNVF